MVPLSEREPIIRRALEEAELRPVHALIFGLKLEPLTVQTPDLVLLSAVARRDSAAFKEQVVDLERRRISPEAAWCDNDCLVFALLLGCEIFGVETPVVANVLDVRERQRNAVPRRVNEVLRALSRKDHAPVEEFGFIKLVYEHLRGQPLRLKSDDVLRVYGTLTRPGFLEELSPFLSLLAVRAYDLIITERQPAPLEEFAQLVEGVERLGDKLSARQVRELLLAFPVKKLWTLATLLLPLLGSVYAAGLGSREVLSAFRTTFAHPGRPERLKVVSVQDAQQIDDTFLKRLATAPPPAAPTPTAKSLFPVLVTTEAPGSPTGKYSVELFLQGASIPEGYAFSERAADAGLQRSVLPVGRSGEGIRAFVPAGDGMERGEFLLWVEAPAGTGMDALAHGLTMRVIE